MYYDNSKIGTNIKNLRKAYGETQKELGAFLNLADTIISMYERGDNIPDRETLQMIAAHYGVSMEKILVEDLSNVDMEELKLNWEDITSLYDVMFPIISSEDALRDAYFKNAYEENLRFRKKIKNGMDIISDREIKRLIKQYELSYSENKILEAVANIVGILISTYINFDYDEAEKRGAAIYYGKGASKGFAKKYLLRSKKEIEIEDSENQSQSTRKIYQDVLEWVNILKKSQSYSDLADYYVALLFIRNIVDNNKGAILNGEFGLDMMMLLLEFDNKYAISYLKTIVDM